jgi:hypothetical protein
VQQQRLDTTQLCHLKPYLLLKSAAQRLSLSTAWSLPFPVH